MVGKVVSICAYTYICVYMFAMQIDICIRRPRVDFNPAGMLTAMSSQKKWMYRCRVYPRDGVCVQGLCCSAYTTHDYTEGNLFLFYFLLVFVSFSQCSRNEHFWGHGTRGNWDDKNGRPCKWNCLLCTLYWDFVVCHRDDCHNVWCRRWRWYVYTFMCVHVSVRAYERVNGCKVDKLTMELSPKNLIP